MSYFIVCKNDKESSNRNNESLLNDGKLRDDLERGIDYDIITGEQWEDIKHKYNREIKCDDFYTVYFDFLCRSKFCEYCRKSKGQKGRNANQSTNSICDYLNYDYCNTIPVSILNNESSDSIDKRIVNNKESSNEDEWILEVGAGYKKEVGGLSEDSDEYCVDRKDELVKQNHKRIKVFGVENIFNAIKDLFINPMISIEDFKKTFVIKCNGCEIHNPEKKFNSFKEKELRLTVELREIKNNPLIVPNDIKKEEERYTKPLGRNRRQQIYSTNPIPIDRTSRGNLSPIEAATKNNLNFEYLNGLDNLGNTCYMNSSLQCLFNCKKLSQSLVETEVIIEDSKESGIGDSEDSDEDSGERREGVINTRKNKYKSFLSAYKKSIIRLGFGGHASPRLLKKEFENIYSLFRGSEQQDAQEFIIGALDAIHEATVLGDGSSDINVTTESIVSRLFYGEFEIVRECMACNTKAVKKDIFSTLSLPIPTNTITLHINYGKYQSVQIQNKIRVSELYKYIPYTPKLLLITEYSGYHMTGIISPYNNCIDSGNIDANSQCTRAGLEHPLPGRQEIRKSSIPENGFKNQYLVRNPSHSGSKKSFVIYEYSKGEIHLLLRTFHTKFFFIASKLQQDVLININDLVFSALSKTSSSDFKGGPVNTRISHIEKVIRENQIVILERVFFRLKRFLQDDIVFEQFKNNVVLNSHLSKDFSRSNLISQLFNRNIFCIDLKIFNYDFIFSSSSVFSNKLHLKDCINNFKKIEGIDYRCNSGGCQGNKSEIYYRFSKFPKYLIIILKRFTYTGSKITDYVHFNEKMILDDGDQDLFSGGNMDGCIKLEENPSHGAGADDPYLKDKKKELYGHKYSLFGVICHMEIGIWSGHYVAYVKKRNSWYCCNDKNIMKGKIDKKNAYVLFYELDD